MNETHAIERRNLAGRTAGYVTAARPTDGGAATAVSLDPLADLAHALPMTEETARRLVADLAPQDDRHTFHAIDLETALVAAELAHLAQMFPAGTARQVMHATLAAARGAIRLEAAGMHHSSGRSARKHYALAYRLRPMTPAPAVIERIEYSLAALLAAAANPTTKENAR